MKDIYGDVTIPDDVLWGKSTQRSLQNFPIGVEKMPQDLIVSLLELKRACAIANCNKGVLEKAKADGIIAAVDELLEGNVMMHFPLAVWQTGSGTQTNMNANEVIANLANLRHEGLNVHPNDDVNKGQSSNDDYPTAMHMMAVRMIQNDLKPALLHIVETLTDLERKGANALKTGRTHLQDATPLSFGQEVSAWTHMMREGLRQLDDVLPYFRTLAIGGTAVGTGLNAYVGFDQDVVNELNKRLQESYNISTNKFHALSSKDAFVFGHGAVNTIATNALKMVNDIRFLASGPRAGIGEINLPANEAGSSIMPGKVNPTQAEALSMVSLQIMGNHQIISMASSQGHFQLNAYMPLIAYNFWQSVRLLSDGINSFNERCAMGITLNEDKMHANLTQSLMTATHLNATLGYDRVAELVKMAHVEHLSIREVVIREGAMTPEAFDAIFNYESMIKPKEL